jgi:hypothetical protein
MQSRYSWLAAIRYQNTIKLSVFLSACGHRAEDCEVIAFLLRHNCFCPLFPRSKR